MTPPFNSEDFVILTVRVKVLKDYLRDRQLSASQFALLLKLAGSQEHTETISDLAKFLGTTEVAVTQALNDLEDRGLIVRHVNPEDGRAKKIAISTDGRVYLEKADQELYAILIKIFNPSGTETNIATLHEGLRLSALLGHRWPESEIAAYPSCTCLASVNFYLKSAEAAMRSVANVTASEGRILQLLGEHDAPLRIGKLAHELQLPAATITRSCKKLIGMGLVTRKADENDRKAAPMALTARGATETAQIDKALNELADREYWSVFSGPNREIAYAIREIFRNVLAEKPE